MNNKVSHICIYDKNGDIYLENNLKLNGLSFVGGKLENGESFKEGALRELHEETGGFFDIKKTILNEIEKNSELVDGILWNGTLYGLKISEEVGVLLVESQKTIIKINNRQIDSANISKKLGKEKLKRKIELTINKI